MYSSPHNSTSKKQTNKQKRNFKIIRIPLLIEFPTIVYILIIRYLYYKYCIATYTMHVCVIFV